MQTNYYPWNVQSLVNWLNEECSKYESLEAFSQVIGIAVFSLTEWKMYQSLNITLEQINALARYRNCDLMQTVQWLGIKEFHLQELIKAQPHQAADLAKALGLERVTNSRRGLENRDSAEGQGLTDMVEFRPPAKALFLGS